MNCKNQKWGGYETPVVILTEMAAEGMLCASIDTELEKYDLLEEMDW